MPSAPLRVCAEPGCPARVTSGRCAAHQREQRQHETRFQQGAYGRPWRRLRDAHLVNHPWCVECQQAGLTIVADEVDHIVPHRGDRALMFDPTNLQSLCVSHHSAKTAREVGFVKRRRD